jgi:alkylated DNA repair dioxygenase AlkB
MMTPGGFRMSVAMTNCGAYGWVTDRMGYRYDEVDPDRHALAPYAGRVSDTGTRCGGECRLR